jgi:hypothetical protein
VLNVSARPVEITPQWAEGMGYNARNDEIRDNVVRDAAGVEAQRDT